MRLRYGLYVLGLFLLFLALFEFVRFGEMREKLERNKREALRIRAEIQRRVDSLDMLKEIVEKNNIPSLSREEALEVMLSKVEELRDLFDVRVRRDLAVEKNVLRMDLELSFKPRSREDLVSRIKKLTGSVSPVLHISRIEIRQIPETEVKVVLTVYQPFLEVKR